MPGYVAAYIHGEGSIGVLIELRFLLSTSAQTTAFKALAHDLALHVAAMDPAVVNPSQLNLKEWNEELERISSSPSIAAMAPPAKVEALRAARERYESNLCLLKQVFIKSTSLLVEGRIAETAAELDEQIEVVRFARFKPSSE